MGFELSRAAATILSLPIRGLAVLQTGIFASLKAIFGCGKFSKNLFVLNCGVTVILTAVLATWLHKKIKKTTEATARMFGLSTEEEELFFETSQDFEDNYLYVVLD